jgi:hypothetical protein
MPACGLTKTLRAIPEMPSRLDSRQVLSPESLTQVSPVSQWRMLVLELLPEKNERPVGGPAARAWGMEGLAT